MHRWGLQPCSVRSRRLCLHAARGLLLVLVPAGRQRSARVCLGQRLRQQRARLRPGRCVLRPRLHQCRSVRGLYLCPKWRSLRSCARLLLGCLHGWQVRGARARLSRGGRDLQRQRRLLRRPVWFRQRGRERMPLAGWLSRGRRNLQQRHRLLLGAVSGGAERCGHLQGTAGLQSHFRALRRSEKLLLGCVRDRRTLSGRGRLPAQGRALSVERRLLLGNLQDRARRCASLRGHAQMQGDRRCLQQDQRVLRQFRHLRCEWALLDRRRLPGCRTALRHRCRLLLRCVHAQHLRQARLSRRLRALRRALHRRRGLLHRQLRRFSVALLAGAVGIAAVERLKESTSRSLRLRNI